ncbi:hypothetical protein AAC03nite_20670 [Alicyclobacillus acidoterrestris]|nr:hypothetical protein AAC03nite_20670 [Alicyclobacillus acidoterrestris]
MVNVSPQVVSNWERAYTRPSAEDFINLATALNEDVSWLMAQDYVERKESRRPRGIDALIPQNLITFPKNMIPIPVLGSIRAGDPIEMVSESSTEYELVDRDLIHNRDSFILRVQGDSMIGDHIYDGDRVVVIATPDFSPSDICVVAINGHEATLKRVKCQGEVCILSPSNPEMEPMVYPADEIHVLGVVVEVRRRLKR